MSRDTMVYYRSFRESLRELPPDLYKVVSETILTDTMLVWRMGEKVERPKEAGTIQAEKLSNLTKDLTSTLTKNLTFIRIRM